MGQKALGHVDLELLRPVSRCVGMTFLVIGDRFIPILSQCAVFQGYHRWKYVSFMPGLCPMITVRHSNAYHHYYNCSVSQSVGGRNRLYK